MNMKYLIPRAAFDFLQEHPDAVFIDVSSEIEFLFVGHPVGALSIPWADPPDWEANTDFAAQVMDVTTQDNPVVLICRSGRRTLDAAKILEAAGLTEVYIVQHGFDGELDEHYHRGRINGWRSCGLPWEQC